MNISALAIASSFVICKEEDQISGDDIIMNISESAFNKFNKTNQVALLKYLLLEVTSITTGKLNYSP
jgi:hypothetical protein